MGTGEKEWSCELLPYNFSSRNKTNKQNNLLTLTVSGEKSYLTRRKKKLKKGINNNNNNNNNNSNNDSNKNEIKRKNKNKRD